ncbi:MAG: GLUG motif-containing protein [Cryomorphaceae bacterium]|nr:hypothetical protein [Flavobacteriales bacterium]
MKRKKPNTNKRVMGNMNIGGIAGSVSGGTIKNSSFGGAIILNADFDRYVAGVLKNVNVGGIVGKAQNAILDNVTSDAKIYIRDVKKFAALENALDKAIDNKGRLQLAKLELEGIKSEIGKPGMAVKVERFLNIVNGVRDVVEPFVPYLMSLVP